MSQHKYKAGDWVTIIKDGYGALITDGTGKIESIQGKNHCIYFEGELRKVWKEGFRKALPHEIPDNKQKYEIGGIINKDKYSWEIKEIKSNGNLYLHAKYSNTYVTHQPRDFKDPSYIYTPPNKQQEINLQVGDTFRNSQGNIKKITYVGIYETQFDDVITGKADFRVTTDAKEKIRSGFYTDYTPVSQQKTIKQWKKEDFLNTKIKVETPEKSRRFQEFMYKNFKMKFIDLNSYLDSKYIFIDKYGTFTISSRLVWFNKHKNKEIFYNDILNENNNQLNNNQNGKTENNDVFGQNLTRGRSKKAATAIAFRKTSKITTSRGYTGNRIKGRTVNAKIGRSEISFSSVSF